MFPVYEMFLESQVFYLQLPFKDQIMQDIAIMNIHGCSIRQNLGCFPGYCWF